MLEFLRDNEEHHFDELVRDGKGCTFFGEPIKDVGKETLFYIIGWLGKEMKRRDELYKHDLEFLGEAQKARLQ